MFWSRTLVSIGIHPTKLSLKEMTKEEQKSMMKLTKKRMKKTMMLTKKRMKKTMK